MRSGTGTRQQGCSTPGQSSVLFQPDRPQNRARSLRVDPYPMGPVGLKEGLPGSVDRNQVRLLGGHGAVDAVVLDPGPDGARKGARGGLMTTEAAPGKLGQVAFDAVHVVAGRTRHIRAAGEAPARSQERDLVTMRVRLR